MGIDKRKHILYGGGQLSAPGDILFAYEFVYQGEGGFRGWPDAVGDRTFYGILPLFFRIVHQSYPVCGLRFDPVVYAQSGKREQDSVCTFSRDRNGGGVFCLIKAESM